MTDATEPPDDMHAPGDERTARHGRPLCDIADSIIGRARGDDRLSLGTILDAIGHRSFGPVLILVGLIVVTPLGAIPGLQSVLAILLILIVGQRLFGRTTPWLPGFIRRVDGDGAKIAASLEKMKPWLEKIDAWTHRRLTWMTGAAAQKIATLVVIFLALLMIPLEMIPWAVWLPGAALLLIGMGFTAKDGIFTLLGLLLAGGAFGFTAWIVL